MDLAKSLFYRGKRQLLDHKKRYRHVTMLQTRLNYCTSEGQCVCWRPNVYLFISPFHVSTY